MPRYYKRQARRVALLVGATLLAALASAAPALASAPNGWIW